jgi:DNA-binding transcriptional LysR family regulator
VLNRIELLRVFLAAVDASSFREAAVRLAVSPQVVSRTVRDLETELGEVLFHRSTRSIQLTDFGHGFARGARQAVAVVDGLFGSRDARAMDELQGTVRVAAPIAIGQRFVWPVLRDLMAAHPGLAFDLRLSDAVVDMVDQRIDVGVRVGNLRDSRFVARTVTTVPLVICAAPSLLRRIDPIRAVDDLHRAPTTALIDRNTGRPWPWTFSRERQFLPERSAFTTDDPQSECEAVFTGIGVGQLSRYLAFEYLRSGALKALLPEVAPKPWPLSVYRSRRDPVPPRVRLGFDAIVEAFKDKSRFPAS